MSGCCARCKVPFAWCGNEACGCHRHSRKRREAVEFEDIRAAVDAELARQRETRGRYL